MQLKFQILATPGTGFQRQRSRQCLFLLGHLCLPIGYLALLFYALLWKAGNIVNLPTKRIGFYNFCLWNLKAEELYCLPFEDLEKVGISKIALVVSRVCVYSAPVLCLFVDTTIWQAIWFKARDGWKLVFVLLSVVILILVVGLLLFTLQTSKWISMCEQSEAFGVFLGALFLLVLHQMVTVLYLTQFLPQEGPLMNI